MRNLSAIALLTFRECLRSKLVTAILIFFAIFVATASLFGAVSVSDQITLVKDFGLFSAALFTVVFSTVAGAILLAKELTRKTIFNILAKPVKRWEFVTGKFLGLFASAAASLFILWLALTVYVGGMASAIDWSLGLAALCLGAELLIVCAAAIFFSALTVTPILTGLFTFGFFLAGRSADFALYFVREGKVTGLGAEVLQVVHTLLPHLDSMNVANNVVFGQVPSAAFIAGCWIYAAGYAGILLTLATVIFERREFN